MDVVQQCSSALEKFLLHGGSVNSQSLIPLFPRSHGFPRLLSVGRRNYEQKYLVPSLKIQFPDQKIWLLLWQVTFLWSKDPVMWFTVSNYMSHENTTKQWIKGSLYNFICEAKSVSNQDVLVMVTCPSKVVHWIETMLSKLGTFHCIYWFVLYFPVIETWHQTGLFWHINQDSCTFINDVCFTAAPLGKLKGLFIFDKR